MKTKQHSLLLSTLVFLSAFMVSVPVMAFEFTQNCGGGRGARWAPNKLPLDYYINQNGSADLSITRVEQIVASSFNAWSEPCNSSFSTTYRGRTSLDALNNNNQVVLSWVENANQWPGQLGDPFGSTIAVTMGRYWSNCTIFNAPIIFNGVGFTFTDNCNQNFCPGGRTDLESIATHEIGHLLGLDHSSIRSATMYFAYSGGSSARTLHQDDINGVSALYPNVCTCQMDSDCQGAREKCVQNRCQRVPCTSNAMCEDGLECDPQSGDCVTPRCTSNAQCEGGFECINETCQSSCPVCRDCTNTNQCGANAVCADLNGDGNGECLVFCDPQGRCPGDGVCFRVPGQNNQVYNFCLNSDASAVGGCPDNYVCDNNFMPPPDPCDGVMCKDVEYCFNGECWPLPGACTATCDFARSPSCLGTKLTTFEAKLNEEECACEQIPTETNCADDGKICVNGACVESTTMNNMNNNMNMNNNTPGDMGMMSNNNTNNMPGEDMGMGSDNNGNNNGQMEEDVVIIIDNRANSPSDAPCVCGSSMVRSKTPASLGLVLLLGLLGFVRRRRLQSL